MDPRSDADLRQRYLDVLSEEGDEAAVEIVRLLDASYNAVPAPSTSPPVKVYFRHGENPRTPLRRTLHWRRSMLVPVACLCFLVLGGVAFALTSMIDLGKPTNTVSTNQYFPLSGFHRMPTHLRQRNKPEMLFLGAQGPTFAFGSIAAERWAVVKTLWEFGTLSHIRVVDHSCRAYAARESYCSIPTFDLTHAQYASSYLAFSSKDLIRGTGFFGLPAHPLQRMSKREMVLFNRYARFEGQPVCQRFEPQPGHYPRAVQYPCSGFADTVWATITNKNSPRTLPLIVIGDYVQTQSQDLFATDFIPTVGNMSQPPLQYRAVQRDLITGTDPQGVHLVEDLNAEANIMTALVCHADGEQPKSVCGRPVIKEIITHVK